MPTGGIADVEALHRMANPPTALTAEQQIRLACARITQEAFVGGLVKDVSKRAAFPKMVGELVAYVTTGKWPDDTNDTNGTNE